MEQIGRIRRVPAPIGARQSFPMATRIGVCYTKRDTRMDVAALHRYYEDLMAQFFPARLAW